MLRLLRILISRQSRADMCEVFKSVLSILSGKIQLLLLLTARCLRGSEVSINVAAGAARSETPHLRTHLHLKMRPSRALSLQQGSPQQLLALPRYPPSHLHRSLPLKTLSLAKLTPAMEKQMHMPRLSPQMVSCLQSSIQQVLRRFSSRVKTCMKMLLQLQQGQACSSCMQLLIRHL